MGHAEEDRTDQQAGARNWATPPRTFGAAEEDAWSSITKWVFVRQHSRCATRLRGMLSRGVNTA